MAETTAPSAIGVTVANACANTPVPLGGKTTLVLPMKDMPADRWRLARASASNLKVIFQHNAL